MQVDRVEKQASAAGDSAERSATVETTDRRRVTHVPSGEGRAVWVVGDTYTFKAVSEDTGGAYMLFEASIPPQAGPPPHIHHWEDEAYYVLEGELEVLDNDRTITVSAGSFVHIPKGALHCFKNTGETPARMLIFFTPAGLEKFFFEVGQPVKEGETAPPLGPEEIEKIIAAAPKHGFEVRLPPER